MRKFYTENPVTEEQIVITHGETGYRPIGHNNGNRVSVEAMAILNDQENNTEKDLEIALACSMWGWNVPAASELSLTAFKVMDSDGYNFSIEESREAAQLAVDRLAEDTEITEEYTIVPIRARWVDVEGLRGIKRLLKEII